MGNGKREMGNGKRETGNGRRVTENGKRYRRTYEPREGEITYAYGGVHKK